MYSERYVTLAAACAIGRFFSIDNYARATAFPWVAPVGIAVFTGLTDSNNPCLDQGSERFEAKLTEVVGLCLNSILSTISPQNNGLIG